MTNFSSADFLRQLLAGLGRRYAAETQQLLANPSNNEAVVRGSVSGVVRALFAVFEHDPQSLQFFRDELLIQSRALDQHLDETAGNDVKD